MFCLHIGTIGTLQDAVQLCVVAMLPNLRRHNMTTVPRTVQEVESVMACADWQVGDDTATEPPAKTPCMG